MKKRSFVEITRKFFEPVLAKPLIYIKSLVPYSLWASLPIITLILLEKITKSVENSDKILFEKYLLFFAISMVLYQVLVWVLRKRGRLEIRTKGLKQIYPPYIQKFIQSDNTKIEKIGTGRMISIIEQGFGSRISLLEKFFMDGVSLVLSLAFIGFAIYKIGNWFFVGFLVSLILTQLVIQYLSRSIKENKYEEAGVKSDRSRNLVRIIMSKFEIQQLGSVNKEIEKLHDNSEQLYKTRV